MGEKRLSKQHRNMTSMPRTNKKLQRCKTAKMQRRGKDAARTAFFQTGPRPKILHFCIFAVFWWFCPWRSCSSTVAKRFGVAICDLDGVFRRIPSQHFAVLHFCTFLVVQSMEVTFWYCSERRFPSASCDLSKLCKGRQLKILQFCIHFGTVLRRGSTGVYKGLLLKISHFCSFLLALFMEDTCWHRPELRFERDL